MIKASHDIHYPVLLREVLEHLSPKDGETYIDGTFGAGGYSRAILEAADCRLYAIDRDPDAIRRAEPLRQDFGGRFTIIEGCFGDIAALRQNIHETEIHGVVFDFGVSSPQLDEAGRGFSFRFDGPLDMRMEQSGPTAADIVNTASVDELTRIFKDYGEERYARKLARAIELDRKTESFETTSQLARLARAVIPKSKDGIDQATRAFQGLRIAVNDELGEIDRGLEGALSILAPEGRLVAVSFHSLEDRRVKQFFKLKSGQGQAISRHAPMADMRGPKADLDIITRKPLRPREDEVSENPRSRSSLLRAARKTPSIKTIQGELP